MIKDGLMATENGTTEIEVREWLNLAVEGTKGYRASLLGKDKQDQITQCDLKIELYKIAIHCLRATCL